MPKWFRSWSWHEIVLDNLYKQPISQRQDASNRGRVLASSHCCAAIVAPSRAFACTGDRESWCPEPLFLWSCNRRGQMKFMGSVVRAPAPDLHDGSSSIQVRRRCILSRSSLSAAPSTSSTTHKERLYTTTSNDISLYRRKVHTTVQYVIVVCLLFWSRCCSSCHY